MESYYKKLKSFIPCLFNTDELRDHNMILTSSAYFIDEDFNALIIIDEITGRYRRTPIPPYTMGKKTETQHFCENAVFKGMVATTRPVHKEQGKFQFEIIENNQSTFFEILNVELMECSPCMYSFEARGIVPPRTKNIEIVIEEDHTGQIYNKYTNRWIWL